MTLRVIGCGNSDRGDDAAGLLVARRLGELGLDTVDHTGDGFALLDLWAAFDRVILVDAMVSGAAPGTVTVWDARDGSPCLAGYRGSTHDSGPAEAIELGRALGRMPREIQLYGIEGANFEPGAPLSAAVLAGIEQAVAMIWGTSPKFGGRGAEETQQDIETEPVTAS